MKSRTKATFQAFLVTLLWSSSWVIIKLTLEHLPPLTFAAYRFVIAFLCLLPFSLKKEAFKQIGKMRGIEWITIIALGILYYAITPGGQNLGLHYLPANTLSLILSFTAVVVAFLGAYLIKEKPTFLQWLGLAIFLIGVAVYFWQRSVIKFSWIGITIGMITMTTNSFSALLGRKINKSTRLSPLLVTTLSMGIGSLVLLAVGVSIEGIPKPTNLHWAIILWLALVNTAFAYQLWNRTQQILPALNSTLINNTMLAQIAILAWLFLDEPLGLVQIIGLVIAMAGVITVQIFSHTNSE